MTKHKPFEVCDCRPDLRVYHCAAEAFDPGLPAMRDYDGVENESQFASLTICGSMRYYQVMLAAAAEGSRLGWMVYMPFVACEESELNMKEMLDQMHFAKIRASWAVAVIGEHIGESTQREIQYARERGKTALKYVGWTGRFEKWT